ncbi:MAG: hypothetical protein ACLFNU_00155 [Bacteroidales bacterium]
MKKDKDNKLLINALISLGIFFLFVLFIVPKYGVNQFDENIRLLDVRVWYTANDVTKLFNNLDVNGREAYASFLLFIDMVYPIVYGVTFILIIAFILKKRFAKSSPFLKLAYLPFGIMFFDYVENTNILILLNQFPAINSSIVILGSVATLLKWLFALLSIGTIIIVSASLLIRNIFLRPKNQPN